MFSISFEINGRTCSFKKKKENFSVIVAGITCSKSTIEKLEQGMKYVQSQEEKQQNNIIDVILES